MSAVCRVRSTHRVVFSRSGSEVEALNALSGCRRCADFLRCRLLHNMRAELARAVADVLHEKRGGHGNG